MLRKPNWAVPLHRTFGRSGGGEKRGAKLRLLASIFDLRAWIEFAARLIRWRLLLATVADALQVTSLSCAIRLPGPRKAPIARVAGVARTAGVTEAPKGNPVAILQRVYPVAGDLIEFNGSNIKVLHPKRDEGGN
jgi:hypothetical protein